MKVLTIISHTEHFQKDNDKIVGLGSTVTEINNLIKVFDEIRHVAMLHHIPAPPSALPYSSENIKFIPIPALGGQGISEKSKIISKAPKVISIIKRSLKGSTYFQFRAPTGIGVYVIPYLTWFCSKKGWFKYAGNWNQKNAPVAYKFQRWCLIHQSRKVTINGHWPDQKKHCLTFENPCLTEEEIIKGNRIISSKSLDPQAIRLCFVGRLEAEKGLDLLIESLIDLDANERSRIESIHIVGDGIHKENFQQMASASGLPFVFHGFLSRLDVHKIYEKSHVIILPSASEGFPKVIAEALNFGCIPVVSNISGISNYIFHKENGLLLSEISKEGVQKELKYLFNLSPEDYERMIHAYRAQIEKFTFTYYNKRILELLESNPPER